MPSQLEPRQVRCPIDEPGQDAVNDPLVTLIEVPSNIVHQDEGLKEGSKQPGPVAAQEAETCLSSGRLGLVVRVQGLVPLCKLGCLQLSSEVTIELVSAEPIRGTPVPPDDLAKLAVPPLIVHCIVPTIGSIFALLPESAKQLESTLLQEVNGRECPPCPFHTCAAGTPGSLSCALHM